MQIQGIQTQNYKPTSFGLKLNHRDMEEICQYVRRERTNTVPEVYTILNYIKNIPGNQCVNIRTNGNVTNAHYDSFKGFAVGKNIGLNIITALKNAFIESHPTAATDKMPRALFEMECLENNNKTVSNLKSLMLSLEE